MDGYHDPTDIAIGSLVTRLQRRQMKTDFEIAQETGLVMRKVLHLAVCNNETELIESIRKAGTRLIKAAPAELVIGNVVRRTLAIARDTIRQQREEEQVINESGTPSPSGVSKSDLGSSERASPMQQKHGGTLTHAPSLSNLMFRLQELSVQQVEAEKRKLSKKKEQGYRDRILQELKEILEEMRNTGRIIAEQAVLHIHSQDSVLTYGNSSTVRQFLSAARRIDRRFNVIVAESEPQLLGREQARHLTGAGIETTLITDSAIFALMPRVDKVVIGVHAVLANGGLICPIGGRLIMEAAFYHHVPVIVVMGMHKLCPIFPTDPDMLNELMSPATVVRFDEDGFEEGNVLVPNPAWDYVPPELVTLYVTNVGTHTPSYIYRLLNEVYYPEDKDLFK